VKIWFYNILHFCVFLHNATLISRLKKYQKSFFSVKWSKNEFFRYFSWPSADFGILFHHEGSTFRKKWIRLFQRKILCWFRIWFLFWPFDTKISHHGYFFKKWAENFQFFGHNFCKIENFKLLIFFRPWVTYIDVFKSKIRKCGKTVG
jgi:hypothetical protein